MPEHDTEAMTFWDHLDELRQVLFRMVIAVVALACVAFACKEPLFDLVLAPSRPDFILYRWLNALAASWNMPSLTVEAFRVEMINTQLASQFTIHMSVACYAGILLASPLSHLSAVRIHQPRPAPRGTPHMPQDSVSRVPLVSMRHPVELLRHFPAFIPFSLDLSGQRKHSQHDYPLLLRQQFHHPLPPVGNGIRNTGHRLPSGQAASDSRRHVEKIP